MNTTALLLHEMKRNHEIMGLINEAAPKKAAWVMDLIKFLEEARATGRLFGANANELRNAIRALKEAKPADVLSALARIARLSPELANEIGPRVFRALKTRANYKSIFDAIKTTGVNNLKMGMDESKMIQQVDDLLEAGITNPEVRGMVRNQIIDEIKTTHAASGGTVTPPAPGGGTTTPVNVGPGGTSTVPATGQGGTANNMANLCAAGNEEEAATEFIKMLKKRGLKVSAKDLQEIRAAIKEFNLRIRGFINGFSGNLTSWAQFADEGIDIQRIMADWENLPVGKQQEIIKAVNKQMEEAFGKWIAGFRMSESSQNIAVQFFHNFFYKKIIMLGKTPKGFGDWISWYWSSFLWSFFAMTIAEVISCTKNGFSRGCLNIITGALDRLTISVIPFINMAWGGANVMYQGIISLLRGIISLGKASWGQDDERENSVISSDLSDEEAKSFVENDMGISNLLPPGFDLSKYQFVYKQVKGKNNQVDVYLMETGGKEEDAEKITTLEKVLSPGNQGGIKLYRIRTK